jgi:hypothetical protein
MGSQAPLGPGGPKRVDFNGDGYEDILWRYYGTGGSNRVWFLGSAEGTRPSGAVDTGMKVDPEGRKAIKSRGAKRTQTPRDMGLTPKRKGRAPVKDPEALMGGVDRRNTGSAMVQDPRQAGGGSTELSRTIVTDPRQVAGLGESLGAAPLLLGGADVLPVGDVNWQIVGAADFDNDTQTDILWRNVYTGSNVVWFMNGTDWMSSAELIPVPDLSWQIMGTGDFDNDTHVDILWRNIADGTNVVWFMNGVEWSSSAMLLGVSDLDWQIAGTGDFNNDTHVDILWRHYGEGGSNVVWYMDNAGWIRSAELIPVADLNWQIVSTGDYNDDGSVDILWRYNGEGGSNVIWYMDGASWAGSAELIPVPDLSWKISVRGMFSDPYRFYEMFIDPTGGEYELPNGMALSVPAGAVNEVSTVSIRRLRPEEVQPTLSGYGVEKYFLAGFEVESGYLMFNQPITVRIPSVPLTSAADLPFRYDLNPSQHAVGLVSRDSDSRSPISMAAGGACQGGLLTETDPESGSTVSFCVPGFDPTKQDIVAAVKDILQDNAGVQCNGQDPPCYCTNVEVMEVSRDYIVSGECEYYSVTGTATYHACGDIVNSWSFIEDLRPAIRTDPAVAEDAVYVINVGDAQTFAYWLEDKLGNTVPSQLLNAHIDDPTGALEILEELPNVVSFMGKSCGKADLVIDAGCENTKTIKISIGDVKEIRIDPPERTTLELCEFLQLSAKVYDHNDQIKEGFPIQWSYVSPDTVWVNLDPNTGFLEANGAGEITVFARACNNSVTDEINLTVHPYLDLQPDGQYIIVGETMPLLVRVEEKCGEVKENPELTWTIPGGGIFSVNISDPMNYSVTGVSPGTGTLTVTYKGVSRSITITVEEEVGIVGLWRVSYTGQESDLWRFTAGGIVAIWDGEEWDYWRGHYNVTENIMTAINVDVGGEDTSNIIATIIDNNTMQGTIHDNYTGTTVAWSAVRISQ